jgi:hypothetical protein
MGTVTRLRGSPIEARLSQEHMRSSKRTRHAEWSSTVFKARDHISSLSMSHLVEVDAVEAESRHEEAMRLPRQLFGLDADSHIRSMTAGTGFECQR